MTRSRAAVTPALLLSLLAAAETLAQGGGEGWEANLPANCQGISHLNFDPAAVGKTGDAGLALPAGGVRLTRVALLPYKATVELLAVSIIHIDSGCRTLQTTWTFGQRLERLAEIDLQAGGLDVRGVTVRLRLLSLDPGGKLILAGEPLRLPAPSKEDLEPTPSWDLLGDPGSDPDLRWTADNRRRGELLRARKFEELEAELTQLAGEGRHPRSFHSKFTWAINAMGGTDRELQEGCEAWCRARPKSAAAFLVRGKFRVAWAWEARGSGWGSEVTEEGSRLLRERLGLAKKDFERAAQLDPKRGDAWAGLVTVAMGLGLPEDQARSYFQKGEAAAPPFCFAAFEAMHMYLLPRWHGSLEKVRAFVKRAVEQHPDQASLKYLDWQTHLYALATPGREAEHFQRPEVSREVSQTLEELARAYPDVRVVAHAQQMLAQLIGDEPAWRRHVQRNADLGDAEASRAVGCNLVTGGQGFPKDPRRGIQCLLRGAWQGDALAMAVLGQCYAYGQGVAADERQATAWLIKAALAGQVDCYEYVAKRYARGKGVPEDPALSVEWTRRGVKAGSAACREMLRSALAQRPDLRQPGDP